jgi:hypothetical protein
MVVAAVALVVALGATNAHGAATNFLLNTSNTSKSQTTLNGSAVAGKALQITNTNTASGATALSLSVASGHTPFTVNSGTKVASLNADSLDCLDSSQLQRRVTGTCPTGSSMSAVAADGTVSCASFAAPLGLEVATTFAFGNSGAPAHTLTAQADCPTGNVPIGGGYTAPPLANNGRMIPTVNSPVYVTDSNNQVVGGGWVATVVGVDSTDKVGSGWTLEVFVNCVTAS